MRHDSECDVGLWRAAETTDVTRALLLTVLEVLSPPTMCVLAADTIVTFGDMILGKPPDAEGARKMLRLLSGTTHLVITGV